jgi:hypothetical protein
VRGEQRADDEPRDREWPDERDDEAKGGSLLELHGFSCSSGTRSFAVDAEIPASGDRRRR